METLDWSCCEEQTLYHQLCLRYSAIRPQLWNKEIICQLSSYDHYIIFSCHYINIVLRFWQSSDLFPKLIFIMMQLGDPVQLLRHCSKWHKSTAKAKRVADVKQGPDLSSKDEDESHFKFETKEQIGLFKVATYLIFIFYLVGFYCQIKISNLNGYSKLSYISIY